MKIEDVTIGAPVEFVSHSMGRPTLYRGRVADTNHGDAEFVYVDVESETRPAVAVYPTPQNTTTYSRPRRHSVAVSLLNRS